MPTMISLWPSLGCDFVLLPRMHDWGAMSLLSVERVHDESATMAQMKVQRAVVGRSSLAALASRMLSAFHLRASSRSLSVLRPLRAVCVL